MKNLLKVIIFVLAINTAFSATLENVALLDIKHGKENFILKLQSKKGPSGSYFFVEITESDKDAFDKLALVIKKLKKGEDFKLNLIIPSFSVSPSGSSYRSDSVTFLGSTSATESLMAD